MAQQLRAVAFIEDLGWGLNIQKVAHNSSSQESDTLFWLPQSPGTPVVLTHTYRQNTPYREK